MQELRERKIIRPSEKRATTEFSQQYVKLILEMLQIKDGNRQPA